MVKVDGAPQGNIGADGTLIVTVAPGKGHLLEIGRDGYQTASQSLNIKAGDNINVLSPLIPIPVQPKLIFYSLGMPSARKLLISLRAVVEYFKM